jgi:hypothetical protein
MGSCADHSCFDPGFSAMRSIDFSPNYLLCLEQASFALSWAGAEVDTAQMTRRLAVSLDKIRALAHVALVHTYRSSIDKRSSLVTWLVLHLQEAYCQSCAAHCHHLLSPLAAFANSAPKSSIALIRSWGSAMTARTTAMAASTAAASAASHVHLLIRVACARGLPPQSLFALAIVQQPDPLA